MKKKTIGIVFLTAMAVLLTVPCGETLAAVAYVDNGPGVGHWKQDETGWWYETAEKSYPVNSWKKIHGVWYHFDERGYMQTGWFRENGSVYYMTESGGMAENVTLTIDGQEYAFGEGGACETDASLLRLPGEGKQPNNLISEEAKSDIHRQADAIADQILAGIVNSSMTKRQQAEAIYAYIRGNFRYAGHSATRDWPTEAYRGLRSHHGDCFTYYACANELLSRCGIPSIEVIRSTDADHFWNLVQVEEGWYHFDTTPRSVGGYYCLWTDAQMHAFSAAHRGCFAFDTSLYPATP